MPQLIGIVIVVSIVLYFLSEAFNWAVGLVGHPIIVVALLAVGFAAFAGFSAQNLVQNRDGPRKALWPFWVGLVAAAILVIVFGRLVYG